MADLTRANRVTVKAMNEGIGYVASFYKTHKLVKEVDSVETGWEIPEGLTKTGERESFREYVIKNADGLGIEWNPADLRDQALIRRPKYDTDQALIEDAQQMIIPELRALVEKCKYPIEWGGISCDDITPLEETSKGTELASLGIVDGKYEKSGNWAWAELKMMMTFKYKSGEAYMPFKLQLVSGQLKKTGLTITKFNDIIKDEIASAGLATLAELDPPKEEKPTSTKAKDKEPEVQAQEQESTDEPKIEIVPKPEDTPVVQTDNGEDKPKRKRQAKGKATE